MTDRIRGTLISGGDAPDIIPGDGREAARQGGEAWQM